MAGKEDHLSEAKHHWKVADVDGSRHDAQLAIGAALIAIAEKLRAMNERAEREAEREELIAEREFTLKSRHGFLGDELSY